jgi:putative acyl-CoA dehydrogenase
VVLLGADVRCLLTLAQTDKGLTCFLLPRHRPDDTRNQFYIQRLKNKLGNSSNASSEVEFRGALAWMVGEEGAACRPSSRWWP